MSRIEQVDYTAADAAAALTRSLRNTGFAVLTNHPISAGRISSFYDLWAGFFGSEEKHRWLRDDSHAGYFPFRSENAKDSEVKDLKEFYHVYPFGRVPPAQETETRALYDDLVSLGNTLLGWIESETPASVRDGFHQPLTAMMQDSTQSLMRILHYPPLPEAIEPGAIRAAAHEDINLITLLLSGSAPGLEAKDSDGVWHAVPCDPGMITINAGDMLDIASNGYFPSTTHRVVNPQNTANGSRFSMPLFLHPRPDASLDGKRTANDYLQERLREIGLKPAPAS